MATTYKKGDFIAKIIETKRDFSTTRLNKNFFDPYSEDFRGISSKNLCNLYDIMFPNLIIGDNEGIFVEFLVNMTINFKINQETIHDFVMHIATKNPKRYHLHKGYIYRELKLLDIYTSVPPLKTKSSLCDIPFCLCEAIIKNAHRLPNAKIYLEQYFPKDCDEEIITKLGNLSILNSLPTILEKCILQGYSPPLEISIKLLDIGYYFREVADQSISNRTDDIYKIISLIIHYFGVDFNANDIKLCACSNSNIILYCTHIEMLLSCCAVVEESAISTIHEHGYYVKLSSPIWDYSENYEKYYDKVHNYHINFPTGNIYYSDYHDYLAQNFIHPQILLREYFSFAPRTKIANFYNKYHGVKIDRYCIENVFIFDNKNMIKYFASLEDPRKVLAPSPYVAYKLFIKYKASVRWFVDKSFKQSSPTYMQEQIFDSFNSIKDS